MLRLILTGATGLCGRALLPLLLADERITNITALCREASAQALQSQLGHHSKLTFLTADLSHPDTLPQLPEADLLLHLAALKDPAPQKLMHAVNVAATDTLLKRCEQAGIKRIIFTGTVNTDLSFKGPYTLSKLQAEHLIRASSLSHTIVRPTLIYGSPYDKGGIAKALAFIRAHGFIPVFGDGNSLEQPIFVSDLARCLHALLFKPSSTDPAAPLYLSGADALPYNELILTLARTFDLPCRLIHLPARPIALTLRGLSAFHLLCPLTPEQISHQCEDLRVDITDQINLCGFTPHNFASGCILYHEALTSKKFE